MNLRYIFVIIIVFLVTGCTEDSDSVSFKEEYGGYNDDGYVDYCG